MYPFALPEKLDRDLARVQAYWEGLRRGGNDMPFWDDLKVDAIGSQAAVLLIDVFAAPERFRFNSFSDALSTSGELKGKFADEVALPHPLEFLRAQASATVEARKPTYYRQEGPGGYARLLLPMWGDGRISMLLGAVTTA